MLRELPEAVFLNPVFRQIETLADFVAKDNFFRVSAAPHHLQINVPGLHQLMYPDSYSKAVLFSGTELYTPDC